MTTEAFRLTADSSCLFKNIFLNLKQHSAMALCNFVDAAFRRRCHICWPRLTMWSQEIYPTWSDVLFFCQVNINRRFTSGRVCSAGQSETILLVLHKQPDVTRPLDLADLFSVNSTSRPIRWQRVQTVRQKCFSVSQHFDLANSIPGKVDNRTNSMAVAGSFGYCPG